MEFFFVWGHFLGLSFFKFGNEVLGGQSNGLPVSGAGTLNPIERWGSSNS